MFDSPNAFFFFFDFFLVLQKNKIKKKKISQLRNMIASLSKYQHINSNI